MKSYQYLLLMVMFVISLNGCARTAPTPDERIRPGDRIGDFLITKREGDDVVYITNLHCPLEGAIETCERPVGAKINVSQGFMPVAGKTAFEEAWAAQTCEMVVEGHPVDLQAFGYDEWKHPIAGMIRVWNVVIIADRPGSVRAESSGVFDGDSWNYTAQINFSEP